MFLMTFLFNTMYCKGLRSLWLKGNGLTKIENLNGQIILRTLYLQENSIEIIENLKPCSKLDTLNLSKNIISKIDNLSCIKELKTQILRFNVLASVESIEHISTLPILNTLDIQSNNIDTLISRCKSLKYVDDQPVFDEERKRYNA